MGKFGRKRKSFTPRHPIQHLDIIPRPDSLPKPEPLPTPDIIPRPILAPPKPEAKTLPPLVGHIRQEEAKPVKREERKVVFKKSVGDLKSESKEHHTKDAIKKFILDNQHHIRSLGDKDKKHIVLHLKRKYDK